MVSLTMNYKLIHPGAEMKPTLAGRVCFRRERIESDSIRFFDVRLHTPVICGHELLPILSRDSGSDEIQGWECIFCNERFENYAAARQNQNKGMARAYATQAHL
jgi:hypothetical protein